MDKALFFLQLTNKDRKLIEGESVVEGFRNFVLINQWSWGLTAGDRGSANRLEPSVFTFRKYTDRSTTALLGLLKSGDLLHSAVMHLKDSSQDSKWYLKITLSDVRVASYDIDLNSEEKGGSAEESWTLRYSKVDFEYTPHSGAALTGQFVRSAKATDQRPSQQLIEEILTLGERVEDSDLKDLKSRFEELVARRMRSRDPAAKVQG